MSSLDYTLIRSSRHSLALQISPGGSIIVRAPSRYPLENIETFLREKKSWIEKHQKSIQEKSSQKQEEAKKFYRLFGVQYNRDNRSEEEIIKIQKQTLGNYLERRIRELSEAKIFRNTYTGFGITRARTRWGSCSSRGNLSFSYRLVSYSEKAIDAVIIHELAHLNHPNHSKKFWNLVYEWMPEYETHIALLKGDG